MESSAHEPIEPEMIDGIGYCSIGCPQHDGKRCYLLGHRPEHHCEPWIISLLEEIAKFKEKEGK